MQTRIVFCFYPILLVFFFSCKNDVKVELPLEEEKVIALLGDMHFASSAAAIHKREERDSMRLIYESQVFEINGVTRQDYDDIINVLESDLTLYFEIEKKVHTYLKDIQNDKS